MIVNKLISSVKLPYEVTKGSFAQRQSKADILTEKLYQNLSSELKDDYTILHFNDLQKKITDILPNKNIKIIVQNLAEEDSQNCEGICEVLFNTNRDIKAISIGMGGISSSVRSVHIPAFVHEVQHFADDIYHPKYLSRLQSLNKQGLTGKKYDNFYDTYYYCPEVVESKRDKKDALKIIKNQTKKFLRGLSISQKIDYIQDMRYSLISEIEAYKRQRTVAKDLKSKGFMVKDFDFGDYPKNGLFEEKINLLKNLATEYMTKERAEHAGKLKKKK